MKLKWGGKRVSWTPTQLKLNNQQAVLVLAALHSGRGRNLGFFSITDIWFNAFENNTGFVVQDLKNLNVILIALVLVTGHARCYILVLECVWENCNVCFHRVWEVLRTLDNLTDNTSVPLALVALQSIASTVRNAECPTRKVKMDTDSRDVEEAASVRHTFTR